MNFFHLALIVMTAFIYGCFNSSSIEFHDDGVAYVQTNRLDSSQISVLKWEVGFPKRDQVVSKGLSISVSIPKYSTSDMKKLTEQVGANSHYIRLMKKNQPKDTMLASFFIPFESPSKSRVQRFRFKQIDKISLALGYASWAISTRLASLACPQMGHNLTIEKATVKSNTNNSLNFTVEGSKNITISEKVENYDLFARVNGGSTLIGEYYFEYALANYHDSRALMEPLTLPERVTISAEKRVNLHSCRNYQPSNDPINKGVESFQWNRNR